MAATRPSIMSDGATMSAPARAWETAVAASHSSVASLSTSPSDHLAAVAVAGVLAVADVGDDDQGRAARRLMRAHGALHDAVVGGKRRTLAFSSLLFRDAEQDDAAEAETGGIRRTP
jgi:hypothetical protein